ncbi:N-6 DNA methylase [Hymenobacter nivis]|uniref:site-specific DNA-methyltransferase (adenine-specific) n=1 Tax=Hymenobacter nivis TaxID=1850093 RepID=A0A2Z3H151_9BACT|nr:N-6 DNA methylase [Hymenobacter nivis]AWM34720.1 restriction endonuclease subunit M [Hymenobacter nivis]
MKTVKKVQSVEPNITELGNGWLKLHKLKYKLEQESLNFEIDKALSDYFTKNGGSGSNRPDTKLLLQDKDLSFYPILIEYKGYKEKLVKLDSDGRVENKTAKNEPHFNNINGFAVNGAIHYANGLLHHTSYTDIIAIGMTGYKSETGELKFDIGVYYVSKTNFGAGQYVGEFTDFSFLAPKNFDWFVGKIGDLHLSPEEIENLKEQREKEIDSSLLKLNNDIYESESGLAESDRVYLVAASIIATLGVPGKVAPLEKTDLKSSSESGNRDGDIIVRKIKSFLDEKALPKEKQDLIVRTLQNTLTTENINKIVDGETQLKRVFSKIVDDLGIYYKIGLTTDFTGKLFNEMYGWLGFTQDKLNDVVLTPSHVANLLVKLARVNKDSYVWDFATGSAGLLVAAMNEMLVDAKNTISSRDELTQKELSIKAEQLLGLELLSSIYMLAILNMILMGDGSSNILNIDSIKDFDGKYSFGKTNTLFPADALVLNPPYSAQGNGMNFVEKALGMMNKGYAAIIIQNSAGSGKAVAYNKRILEKNTLLASIKMPVDIFIGKSSVQTNIYVFKVNEKHHRDEMVKFINFSNDGYTRTSRKKASNNLKDSDRAKQRYDEIVNLVRFGRSKLDIFTNKEYYEGKIDPTSGVDWNQSAPTDTKTILRDFQKTLSDHMLWDISGIIKQTNTEAEVLAKLNNKLQENNWVEFKLDDLFKKAKIKSLKYKASELPSEATEDFALAALTAGIQNQGLNNFVPSHGATILKNVISISANGANTGATFFQSKEFTVLQDAYVIEWNYNNEELSNNQYLFLTAAISKTIYGNYEWTNKASWERIKSQKIQLPTKGQKIDFEFMEAFVAELEAERIGVIESYLNKYKKATKEQVEHR